MLGSSLGRPKNKPFFQIRTYAWLRTALDHPTCTIVGISYSQSDTPRVLKHENVVLPTQRQCERKVR